MPGGAPMPGGTPMPGMHGMPMGSGGHHDMSGQMYNQQADQYYGQQTGYDNQMVYKDAHGNDLPPPQPLKETADMVKRLFFVSQPEKLPLPTLKDLFCRFGDLVHIGYMPGMSSDLP